MPSAQFLSSHLHPIPSVGFWCAPGVPSSPCTDIQPLHAVVPTPAHDCPLSRVEPTPALLCAITFFFPLPLLLPFKYRGNPMRPQTLHWTPPLSHLLSQGLSEGRLLPLQQTFSHVWRHCFGCDNWEKGCYWHLVAGGQKCCC